MNEERRIALESAIQIVRGYSGQVEDVLSAAERFYAFLSDQQLEKEVK